MVEEVRGLRALFRDPADASGTLGDTGFDVKLGSGGIRDVEMVVQALQLLHAGKRPDLRERNTPRALPRLVVAGLLGDREAQTLLDAYRFLAAARAPGAGGDRRPAAPAAGDGRGAGRLRAWPGVRRSGRLRRRGRRDAGGGRGDRRDTGRAARRGAPGGRAAARSAARPRGAGATGGERRIPRRRGRRRHAGAGRRAHAGGVPRGGNRLARSRSRAGAFSRPRAAGLGGAHGAAARSPAARSHAGDAVRHQRSAGRAAGAPPGDVGAVPRWPR